MNFQKAKKFILDILFPISCLGCGKPEEWLCGDCLSRIPLKFDQVCPVCENKITPDGRTCFTCRGKTSLAGLLASTSYKFEIVAAAVHNLKYRMAKSFDVPLGAIMVKSYLTSGFPLPDIIIPVPLHKRRLRWRGFNQAELLANYLGQNLAPGFEIPVIGNLLARKKYTGPQMGIKNYFRRKENLKDAFTIANNSLLNNKTVLLVDDIATTGTTLFECAKTLKQNGAKVVFAVVIARQEYKKN
jgi:competence protein ComFC